MQSTEFRFAFHAHDFGASVHFYHDTIGLPFIGGWDRPDGKGALLSAGGGAVIEIHGAAEGSRYEGPAPEAINLALKLSDEHAVQAMHERLREAGVSLSGPPQDQPWGHYTFIAEDPDSVPVHFYCEKNTDSDR
jgi:catechol 2,3-dioxygenase-like lactoylglutathione lyase family enzyme